MPSPANDWIERLPDDRLIAEFSLWSADLLRLEAEIARVEPHADLFHVDVADGHFSRALLFFPDLVAGVRRATGRPIHVHLMVADDVLLDQAEQFAAAGADLISVHAENAAAAAALDLLDDRGVAAGLVLNVETPVAAAWPFLDRIRFLTLLGTPIGVKGRGLDSRSIIRMIEAGVLIAPSRGKCRRLLAADGGIREETVPLLRRAGADSVVMGSLAFAAPSLEDRMNWLKGL
ncbi:ribulose-phosphate 3-epimerase [Aquisphaera insulae]|uniref:ribulose-phosphate 3-epimerase n=1 Tax=Aquisphaera insulae TaxID=2712864 RepID=UPI0013ECD9CF|nr:ribulose-phosphate 3-epimerase [Aquisphaera insulae]